LICSVHVGCLLTEEWGGASYCQRHRQIQADADVCGGIPSLHSGIEFTRHPINGIKIFGYGRDTENLDLLYDLLEPYADDVYTYIQGVSGGIVNTLGGGSMDYSE
jgi:hypothetical protein